MLSAKQTTTETEVDELTRALNDQVEEGRKLWNRSYSEKQAYWARTAAYCWSNSDTCYNYCGWYPHYCNEFCYNLPEYCVSNKYVNAPTAVADWCSIVDAAKDANVYSFYSDDWQTDVEDICKNRNISSSACLAV